MSNRFLPIWTILTLAAALAACGDAALPDAQRQPGAIEIASETPPPPTTDPLAWQPVELDEAGLTLLVPPDWQSLEDGGFWSPAAGERLSASVQQLPLGTPLWSVFLPTEDFDVVESRSFASGVGMGEYLVIAVYRSARQAAPNRYEMHILVNSGDHPAIDFTVSAPSLEAVEALRPAIERMAAEAGWK